MRAKPHLRYAIITTVTAGDWCVRPPVSPQARAQRPNLPTTWEARLIECRGGRLQHYLTSLPDPRQYPARELVAQYVQRWEIELGFREIRQGLLHDAPVLRSKQPERVGQEWWSTLLAYDLVRQAMRQMPDEMHVAPQCLSFQWLTLAITMALTGGSLDDAETLGHLADSSFSSGVKRGVFMVCSYEEFIGWDCLPDRGQSIAGSEVSRASVERFTQSMKTMRKGLQILVCRPFPTIGSASTRRVPWRYLKPNLPFGFFQSARGGIVSIVSQCSAILP